MRAAILCLAISAMAIPAAHAQQTTITRLDGTTISAEQIDQTMTKLITAAEVTGAGIAIIDHSKLAYLKAYGFRDREKNLPLTVDSVMSAASISKSAFAYLVMELVDQGVLDLDKPVYRSEERRVGK